MTLQDPKTQPQQSQTTIQALSLDATERYGETKIMAGYLSKRAKRHPLILRDLPPHVHSTMLNALTVTKELRIQQRLICTSPKMSFSAIVLNCSMDLLRLVAVHLIPSDFQLEPSAPLPVPVAGHELRTALVQLTATITQYGVRAS